MARIETEALERECDILTLEVEELLAPERIRTVLNEHMTLVTAEKINIKKRH